MTKPRLQCPGWSAAASAGVAPSQPTPLASTADLNFPPRSCWAPPRRTARAVGAQESKLKHLALRSNIAVRKGEGKEVLYR